MVDGVSERRQSPRPLSVASTAEISASYGATRLQYRKGGAPENEWFLNTGEWHSICSFVNFQSSAKIRIGQKESNMLSQCANSQCGKPFLKLREGKLFVVETEGVPRPEEKIPASFASTRRQQRSIEHFWLCDNCATRWTLIYDRERGITLTARIRPNTNAASQAAGKGVA